MWQFIRNLDSDVRQGCASGGRTAIDGSGGRAILAGLRLETRPVGLFDAIRAVSLSGGSIASCRNKSQRPVELR